MQRQLHEEEHEPYRFERESVEVQTEQVASEDLQAARELAGAEMRKNLPLGIAQGGLAAWVMTELARLNNPTLRMEEQNAWLLYAVLGGIAGLAAALGRRNTAWAASGMAAGALISPSLLEWLCRVEGYPLFDNPATSSLVVVAAISLGAMVWLKKVRPLPAAILGGLGYFVLDVVYNIARHGAGPGLSLAAWVSAEHGFLVGGSLALLQVSSKRLLDWRSQWVDRAADWTLARLKQSKGE